MRQIALLILVGALGFIALGAYRVIASPSPADGVRMEVDVSASTDDDYSLAARVIARRVENKTRIVRTNELVVEISDLDSKRADDVAKRIERRVELAVHVIDPP